MRHTLVMPTMRRLTYEKPREMRSRVGCSSLVRVSRRELVGMSNDHFPLAVLQSVDLGATQRSRHYAPIHRSIHVLEIDGAGEVGSNDRQKVLDAAIGGIDPG